MNFTSVTKKQIETLMFEAGEAGDLAMVRVCEHALANSPSARAKVQAALQLAAAMKDK